MQANTKLTTNQKLHLAEMKRNNPDVTLVDNMQTTVAYRELGNTVEFALSVMSDNEKKFRRKVGEYHAMYRFSYLENTVKMARDDFFYMLGNTFYVMI
jgi:hypothetical protein